MACEIGQGDWHRPVMHECPVHKKSLSPQPLPKPQPKDDTYLIKEELELNKLRLSQIRALLQKMKEEIKQCKTILHKEVGREVDIPAMLRSGRGPGWQSRAQEIMNLRLKLVAMRCKFLDPTHKPFYRGPFDPRKEFDLKKLPQKQENLYNTVLEEKKIHILQQDQPINVLKKELRDLRLMSRASRFRTENLNSKIKSVSEDLQRFKSKAESDFQVIEYLIDHQDLMKMMLDPSTMQLDPTLKLHMIHKESQEDISDLHKFKTLFEKSEKEKRLFENTMDLLTEELDKINQHLIESERLCVESKCRMAALSVLNVQEKPTTKDKSQKGKDKPDQASSETANELQLLADENKCLREFLLSPLLSNREDFNLFIKTMNSAKEEFSRAAGSLKMRLRTKKSESNVLLD